MEDVDRLLEPNRIYGSIGVAVMRLYDLQNARTETLPRLRGRRCAAELCDPESVAHVLLDRRRKAQEIALGRPDPMQRSLVGSQDTSHLRIIPVLGYSRKSRAVAHRTSRRELVLLSHDAVVTCSQNSVEDRKHQHLAPFRID